MDKKVACIVVTYNRKDLLIKCLEAVKKQIFKPHTVFIIDNASTDGTQQLLEDLGYINSRVNNINFNYLLLDENIGGSGGFYTGFKVAYESEEHFNAFWVMDDDGVADERQLLELIPYLDRYHYVSPNVRSIENPDLGAFFVPSNNQEIDEEGNYLGVANPFNGVIYSRELVSNVGYPEKNMFIWGDEINYDARAVKLGYHPIIVIKALHFHPQNRQTKSPSIFNRSIVIPEQDWKLYCFARNRVYNSKVINGTIYTIGRILIDLFDFIFALYRKHQLGRIKIVCVAQKDGFKGVLYVNRKFI